MWNMKVTLIPVVICALGTVPKGLESKLEELYIGRRVEAIETKELWGSARILRRVLKTRGNLPVTQTPVKDTLRLIGRQKKKK